MYLKVSLRVQKKGFVGLHETYCSSFLTLLSIFTQRYLREIIKVGGWFCFLNVTPFPQFLFCFGEKDMKFSILWLDSECIYIYMYFFNSLK